MRGVSISYFVRENYLSPSKGTFGRGGERVIGSVCIVNELELTGGR